MTTSIGRLRVVQAVIDGRVGYLTTSSMWESKTALVDEPWEGKHFPETPAGDDHLNKFLGALVYPGLEAWAKSGLRIDAAPVVKVYELVSHDYSGAV